MHTPDCTHTLDRRTHTVKPTPTIGRYGDNPMFPMPMTKKYHSVSLGRMSLRYVHIENTVSMIDIKH